MSKDNKVLQDNQSKPHVSEPVKTKIPELKTAVFNPATLLNSAILNAMSAQKGNPMAQYKWIILGLLFLSLSGCNLSETKTPATLPKNPMPTVTTSSPYVAHLATDTLVPSATPFQAATTTTQTQHEIETTPPPIKTRTPSPKNIASGTIYQIW